jgi:hypothetical protein
MPRVCYSAKASDKLTKPTQENLLRQGSETVSHSSDRRLTCGAVTGHHAFDGARRIVEGALRVSMEVKAYGCHGMAVPARHAGD